jgi:hypothetical protein
MNPSKGNSMNHMGLFIRISFILSVYDFNENHAMLEGKPMSVMSFSTNTKVSFKIRLTVVLRKIVRPDFS